MRKYLNFSVVITMALISFLCLSVGISFSYLSKVAVGTTQTITTGNLDATLSYTPITNLVFADMDDQSGIKLDDYATISITKNNQYSVFYTLSISYSVSSIPSGLTTSSLLPMEYIRVAVFEVTDGVVASDSIIGPTSIADLPLLTVNPSNIFQDKYLLAFGNLAAGSASKVYAIKAWLDEDIPQVYEDSIIYLDMNVEQEPLIAKSLYNISGIVTSSGSPVSEAVVSIQNGVIKATTSATGAYTLSNVPEGTYTLSVQNNSTSYSTTVHVQYGSAVSLNATTPPSGATGTYLQNSAFTYYTTPGKIISANGLTNNSNNVAAAAYTIPPAYVITGLDSISVLPITGLNIALTNPNNLVLTLSS